jgi:hypothetical protein
VAARISPLVSESISPFANHRVARQEDRAAAARQEAGSCGESSRDLAICDRGEQLAEQRRLTTRWLESGETSPMPIAAG